MQHLPNHPLTPELCQAFLALEQCGGILGHAAVKLREQTPNLSKRIKVLVTGSTGILPRPWLEKRGKKFFLTTEGRAMLPLVKEHVERWNELLLRAGAEQKPRLTVACGQEAAGGVVLKAATAFRQHQPHTIFKIAVVRSARRLEGLTSGIYDLALVTQDPHRIKQSVRSEVNIVEVEDDELVLACATTPSVWRDDFKNNSEPVLASELKKWPLVVPEADSPIRQQLDEQLKRLAEVPTIAVEVGGWRVILGYVLAGFGVGLLPKSVALDAKSKVCWRPIHERLRPVNRVRAVHLNPPANPELVAEFVKALKE